MALGYATAVIAGVALTNCKVLVIDGANLLAQTTGSTQVAADGTVYVQTLAPLGGQAFGLRAEFLSPTLLNAVAAAVEAALAAGSGFLVEAEDDIHNFAVMAYPDFNAGWLSYEEQRTNPDTIKNVTFRFITSGEEVES